MKKDNHKFLKLDRVDANKIELKERKSKFIEIYQPITTEHAHNQSERCLECGNPYCQWECPLHNYIPVWLKMTLEDRVEEAAQLSHETNSLPEICGRVCPQDRLCEGSCTLNDGFGAVTIGNVEKYITDTAFAKGWKYSYPVLAHDAKSVAIIGSGPAGLACADVLARNGVKAVVFERSGFIGGLLTYGIPAFKLEKEIIEHRYKLLQDAGVEFRLNCEIGRDIMLDQLEQDFAAVFIATGTYQAVTESSINNHNDTNIWQALDYLTSINSDVLAKNPIQLHSKIANKKIVVLGGGDTSMDCIRSSLRLGAASVYGVYRRDEASMPGSRREFTNAKEEGAIFEFNAQPIAIVHNNGIISGVKFIRTKLVVQENGKSILEHIHGSEFVIEADLVITAFGFHPEAMPWLGSDTIDHHGRIKLFNLKTKQLVGGKLYAGGDIVRGASLVVHAVADGMQAARDIVANLNVL